MLDASIIIPVLNQWKHTHDCLVALYAHEAELVREVIVVNNGSTDETSVGLARFCANHPNLRVITYARNQGYSAANNAAAEIAAGRYLVLLNNDTVPQPGWLSTLIATLADPSIGVVGPRLLFPLTRTTNHAGYSFDLASNTYTNRWCFAPGDSPEVCAELDVLALLGACLCMERSLYLRTGGCAEYGLEDIDLCLKIREFGYRARYVPASIVLHHGSVTLVNTDSTLLLSADTSKFSLRWPSIAVQQMQASLSPESFASLAEHRLRVVYALEESVRMVTTAVSQVALGNYSAAEFTLLSALELWRANEAAYEELIILLVSQQRTSDALTVLDSYRKAVPGSEKLHTLSALLNENGIAVAPLGKG